MDIKRDNTHCCVPQCNSVGWRNPSLHFHRFPNVKKAGELGKKNVIRKKRWILALKIGKEVSNRMRVCSKHFREDDYIRGSASRRHLKIYAVPSLHLPVLPSDNVDKMPEKKRKADRCVAMESFVKLEMEENVKTSEVLPTVASNNEDLVCGAMTTNPNVIRFSVEPNLKQISKNFRENVETSKVPTMASNNDSLVCGAKSTNPKEMHFSVEPNLEQIRESISNFAKERNWEQYHQPRNLLLAMVGEVGELSEIFQWKGEVKEGLPGWSEEEKEHLGQELSGVLLYLVRLSEKCHIDLPAAVMKKMVLYAKKFPVTEAW